LEPSLVPRVFIPALLRSWTAGADCVEVEGRTVRQVIEALERAYPGLRERLCDGDELKPGLRVAVDNKIGNLGLLEKVGEHSEVHFLPAIGGG
jgi:sulfur-carrier protein